jgi:hypothetical protein
MNRLIVRLGDSRHWMQDYLTFNAYAVIVSRNVRAPCAHANPCCVLSGNPYPEELHVLLHYSGMRRAYVGYTLAIELERQGRRHRPRAALKAARRAAERHTRVQMIMAFGLPVFGAAAWATFKVAQQQLWPLMAPLIK